MTPLSISIVTPSLNQASFIQATISSVVDQGYPALEYIVVDGGSDDGSTEIIRRHAERIAWWVSERDSGQSDAINKGLSRARGEVLAYLNSDDVYLPGAFLAVARAFASDPGLLWLSGQCLVFGPDVDPYLLTPRPPSRPAGWLVRNPLPQPAVFFRRAIVERYGAFDSSLHYAFDWEYWIRLGLAGQRCGTVNLPLAALRWHPQSKSVRQQPAFDIEAAVLRERFIPGLMRAERRWLIRELYANDLIAAAGAAGARGDWRHARTRWWQLLSRQPGRLLSAGVMRQVLRSLAAIVGYKGRQPSAT